MARAGGTGGFVQGPLLELGRWYQIDLVYDTSNDNDFVLEWRLDGVEQPRATYQAGVAADIVTVGLGYEGSDSSGRCYFKHRPVATGWIDRPISLSSEPAPGLTPPIGSRLLGAARDMARERARGARLLYLDLTRHPRKPGCTKRTRECCIYTWGVDAVMPNCCVSHLKGLVFFIEDLLTRNGITHWLDYGTLLGAVRDGEFIPWDQDIDFGIYAADRWALIALGPEFRAAGYHFDPQTLRVVYGKFNYNHVDFTLWWEENGWLEGGKESWRFPTGYLGRFDVVRLYGKTFPAPSPADRFLASEHRYGPSYRSPRRFILNYYLRPPGVFGHLPLEIFGDSETAELDETDPAAAELIDRIADVDWRLHERLGSRFFHRPVWVGGTPAILRVLQRWVVAGLPGLPDEDRVANLRNALAEVDVGPAKEQALRRLALAEQALREMERPNGWFLRMRRRLTWLGAAAATGVTGRPGPHRFPYWIG